jgi:hypothetical protein
MRTADGGKGLPRRDASARECVSHISRMERSLRCRDWSLAWKPGRLQEPTRSTTSSAVRSRVSMLATNRGTLRIVPPRDAAARSAISSTESSSSCPSSFFDNQIFKVEAYDAEAHFAVSLESNKIHSALGLTRRLRCVKRSVLFRVGRRLSLPSPWRRHRCAR